MAHSPVIAVGADHGGYQLKQRLLRALAKAGWRARDVGTHREAPCDYPRYAATVGQAVAAGRAARGLLICKSGAGMAIAANKVSGVRAVVVQTLASARQSRRHNDANVLVLGAVGLTPAKAERLLETWLATDFEGGRHARRIRQITQLERASAQRRRLLS
ncbi:MAG: ribose 5-phosphate isomerase B [Omnitrophica WOR_2 bacterium RIFCSPHIGHO2_02_FULL_68_15]|nr:MAG: ribose 5-phosphate isomerase B [Omnitrophica WOR_2 bacterium RIFCSPHIGHO2_02_FULL_68_15]